MKKSKILITLTITAIVILSMAGIADNKENKEEKINQINETWEVMTYIDPETGVNYLIFDHYGKAGAAVRVDQDGKPIVTKIEKDLE